MTEDFWIIVVLWVTSGVCYFIGFNTGIKAERTKWNKLIEEGKINKPE